jgi:hypothetical protein
VTDDEFAEWARYENLADTEAEAQAEAARSEVEAFVDEHYAFARGYDRELLIEAGLPAVGRLDTDLWEALQTEWRAISQARSRERRPTRRLSRTCARGDVRIRRASRRLRSGRPRGRRRVARATAPDGDSGSSEPPGVAPGGAQAIEVRL